MRKSIKGADFKALERVLEELKEDTRPKIVEGLRDRKALKEFGISNIQLIHQGPLQKIVSKIKEKEVILLTDYDRKGRFLTKRLVELFRGEGIKVDLDYRHKLKKYAKIGTIEELPAKYNELKKYIQRR